jgi:chromosome partitioning protein
MNTTFPLPAETRIIVIANQKGGVAKSTTAVNLGAALAEAGATVLIIDLDPQGNASTALDINKHAENMLSIYDVLIEDKPLDEAMQETAFSGNLYCVPATIDLAGAEIELFSLINRENRLKLALEACDMGFNYILIDCPPSLGLLTVNAFAAGHEILVPIQCEFYALEGVSQLIGSVDQIQKHLNPNLHISTVLLTMYDARTNLADQVAEQVRTYFPEQTLKTKIPRSVRAAEAPSHGKTLIEYEPSGPAALAYVEAARELAERGAR